MSYKTEFTWEIFISLVNYLSYKDRINFTRLEKELLKCYWNNMSRHDILKVLDKKRLELKYFYKNDYFFIMGLEPNLMRKLSILIEYPVNKNSFREVFKGIWEAENYQNLVKIECLEQ